MDRHHEYPAQFLGVLVHSLVSACLSSMVISKDNSTTQEK